MPVGSSNWTAECFFLFLKKPQIVHKSGRLIEATSSLWRYPRGMQIKPGAVVSVLPSMGHHGGCRSWYGICCVLLDTVEEQYDAWEGPFEFIAVCGSTVDHNHILADHSCNSSSRKCHFVSTENSTNNKRAAIWKKLIQFICSAYLQ